MNHSYCKALFATNPMLALDSGKAPEPYARGLQKAQRERAGLSEPPNKELGMSNFFCRLK